jgi:hypothetical protein
MRKSRRPTLSLQKWLALARSKPIQRRIAADSFLDVYPILIKEAADRQNVRWQDAVALLHIVYAWMPTMLRTELVGKFDSKGRSNIVKLLDQAKSGPLLLADQIDSLTKFSNNSVVGASKLLHLLNPKQYPIWDARVARRFLWPKVARATLNRAERYCEYQNRVLEWSRDSRVRCACEKIRTVDPRLKGVSRVRLIELVMFRSAK